MGRAIKKKRVTSPSGRTAAAGPRRKLRMTRQHVVPTMSVAAHGHAYFARQLETWGGEQRQSRKQAADLTFGKREEHAQSFPEASGGVSGGRERIISIDARADRAESDFSTRLHPASVVRQAQQMRPQCTRPDSRQWAQSKGPILHIPCMRAHVMVRKCGGNAAEMVRCGRGSSSSRTNI